MSALSRLLLTALAAALAAPLLSARCQDPSFPERFVEVLNAGDVEAYGRFRAEAFVDQSSPEERWRASFARLRRDFGTFEVREVRRTPERVEISVGSSEMPGAHIVLEFEVEPAPPHRIMQVGLSVQDGALPDAGELGIGAPALEGLRSPAAISGAIDDYLRELAARDVFSGVLRVQRGESVVYEGAFGLASKSYEVPNTPGTLFRVGSITKPFLRIAFANLVEEGRLDPEATIGAYLPDYPNSEAASRVTLRHLAEHRSGLATYDFGAFRQLANWRFRRPRDYFRFFADAPLQFEPGERTAYSNAGYIVLGAVIEAVTGRPWEDAVRKYVYEPAGMAASTFFAADRPYPNAATGYWKCAGRSGPWCLNNSILEVEGTPSGGSYSTAEDLGRFYLALQAGRLAPDPWTHWIFTEEWPGPEVPVDRGRWHNGWAGGAEGVNAMVGEQGGWIVSMVSNYDEPAGEHIALKVLEALRNASEAQPEEQ